MTQRDKPWQIAADLETAAKAVKAASDALDAIDTSVFREVDAIPGTHRVGNDMVRALQALSDRYQDIADGEVL